MRNRILELKQELSQPNLYGAQSFTLTAPRIRTRKRLSRAKQGSQPIDDNQYLLNALLFFYPESGLQLYQLNDQLKQLAAVMIYDAITASRQMDRVPRPPSGRPSVIWALKQVVRALFVDAQARGVYESVRATVARNRRSEFELARMGLAQSRSMSEALSAINIQVDGTVPVLQQPTSMSCWATVTTMLYSWRRRQSLAIDTVLGDIGSQYLTMFQQDQGLPGNLKQAFIRDAGLVAEPPHNPTIERWAEMLKDFGPLWVTTDENPSQNFSIHARVLISMQGDGTANGTQMRFIDPAIGRVVTESFSHFLTKYESEAANRPDNFQLRIQIVHWPVGVAVSGSQSFSNSTSQSMEELGLYILSDTGALVALQMTPPSAVVTTTDIQQEINIRLLYLAHEVEGAVNNFRNWFNQSNSKVSDMGPFAKFIRGKASMLFKLAGPLSTGMSLVYDAMNLAIDEAIKAQIRSINNFVDQLILHTRSQTMRLMREKIQSVTQESLNQAVDAANDGEVNAHNHMQIVDQIVTSQFEVPNYPRQQLWPRFLEELIEQYLTYFWSEVKSDTERGIMLTSQGNRTFEQVMDFFASDAVRVYQLEPIASSDPRIQRLIQAITAGQWSNSLSHTGQFPHYERIAAGMNTDVQQAISNSNFDHMRKNMLRAVLSIPR